jgi:hypothetical protein
MKGLENVQRIRQPNSSVACYFVWFRLNDRRPIVGKSIRFRSLAGSFLCSQLVSM